MRNICIMSYKIKLRHKSGPDTSEDTINVGSAKVLSGRIFVLSVFASHPSSLWIPSEIEDMKRKLFEAERWLQHQARRYGKNVEFHNSGYGLGGLFIDRDIPLSYPAANSYHYPGSVVRKIGFENHDAFMGWVQRETGCPQCLVVCFAHQQGRSYAAPTTWPYFKANPATNTLEACLVYWKDINGSLSSSTSIAHEMLHLFGAWDLYGYYGDLDQVHNDTNRALLAGKMFPRSIMHHSSQDIWALDIDEVSAWLVGLKPVGKDWYKWFEPWQEEYVAQF